jgi:predicted negative regulator of RcsB-dependent stress response
VRAETRHQLKQDRFSKATLSAAEKTFDWSAEHKTRVIGGIVIVLVLAGVGFGTWSYLTQQDQKASFALNQAVRTLDTPLRPAGMPAQPEFPSFASSQERATQAHKQFQQVADEYPHTRSGEIARYFLGVTASQLGDNASAVRDLQAVADSRNHEIGALAKLALASVYRDQGKNKDAIALYQGLIARPAPTVSKAMAEMELAGTYESMGQPVDAKNLYQQIQKEDPTSQAAQLAAQKLKDLK